MILARCAYTLREYAQILRSRQIPYSWIDTQKSTSTLAALNALWSLEHGEPVCGEDWAEAVNLLIHKDSERGILLKRGEKSAWKDGRRNDIVFVRPVAEDMDRAGCSEALIGMIRQGDWTDAIVKQSSERARNWRDTAIEHGLDAANDPPVKLSTVHSAKGLEADHVILSTQLSTAVGNAMRNPDHFDEECRITYVGVTRARKALTILDDADDYDKRMRISNAWL
jgi:hypothetical protein